MGTDVERKPLDSSATSPRVLIVEDEFLIALDLEETVRSLGLEVAGLAANREQAMQLASVTDIAFVDVNLLDGATGPEIGRRLVEDFGVSVVFMTGNPEAVADRVAGALGILSKPVMPSVVERSLRYAVNMRRSA